LWEAFLLQMNDFDRLLDVQLRHMLDPVVATPAPPRRGRHPRAGRPILAVIASIELPSEAIPVEPVVVTVPVTSSPL
jgi:hypothetical protein